jgi:hypothetical protein
MTWLGKIFALLVFVLALANVWFITTVWVTRNNWKVQRDEYKAEYQKSLDARSAEYAAYRAELEPLKGQVQSLRAELAAAQKTREEAEDENRKNKETFTKAVTGFASVTKSGTDVQTKIDANQAINDEALRRSVLLENENTALIVSKATADREKLAAESGRRRAEGIADMAARQVEDLRNMVAELRQAGGDPGRAVLRRAGAGEVAVPESLRGTVTHVQDKDPQTGIPGELVQISLGLDAGLQRGAVLDLSRETGAPKYLGTVTIDTVYPKYAVGVFRPADANKPLRRLKPDEFPQVGDTVRVREARGTTTVGQR